MTGRNCLEKSIKCFFYILVLFSSMGRLAAQSKTQHKPIHLLYIVDANVEYLIPYIEDKIRKLSYPNTHDPVYIVSSFNAIVEKQKLQSNINSKLISLHVENLETTLSGSSPEYKRIADTIRNADLLLKIKVNPFSPLIEYQFSLYSVLRPQNGPKFQLESIKSSVAIINPSKNNYGTELTFALKKIFLDAHAPPTYEILANRKMIDSTYYYGDLDTIILQPKVTKSDSKAEDWTYMWKQIVPIKPQLGLASIDTFQTLPNPQIGSYKVSLLIKDGTESSQPAVARIKVIKQPRISFLRNINSFYNKSIIIQNYVFSSHRSAFVPSIYLSLNNGATKGDSVKLTTTLIKDEKLKVFAENKLSSGWTGEN